MKKNEIVIPPQFLTKSICSQFPSCGGCTYMNAEYSHELFLKEQTVRDVLSNFWDETKFLGTVAAPSLTHYRNKMEFSFGDSGKDGQLKLGMRNRGSRYEVSSASQCVICDEDFNSVASSVLSYFAEKTSEKFYHTNKKTGTLRNLCIRKSRATGEVLANLVTTPDFCANLNELTHALKQIPLKGVLAGFLHTVSSSQADAVKPDSCEVLFGKDFIMEEINNLLFKITPFSFFQTNSRGAELLYETVADFCGNVSGKTIFDLYCGTGTIAQILSKKGAKSVFGAELVSEAAEAARSNAALNNLTNCQFITGDVKDTIKQLPINPDIIVLDPPRDGLHPKALPEIAAFNANKIVYVSCKPSSLARDVPLLLSFGYRLTRLKCHDLFPRTMHIETVAEFEKP